eukprot:10904678-Prorocentrum_lima.AAC.1
MVFGSEALVSLLLGVACKRTAARHFACVRPARVAAAWCALAPTLVQVEGHPLLPGQKTLGLG